MEKAACRNRGEQNKTEGCRFFLIFCKCCSCNRSRDRGGGWGGRGKRLREGNDSISSIQSGQRGMVRGSAIVCANSLAPAVPSLSSLNALGSAKRSRLPNGAFYHLLPFRLKGRWGCSVKRHSSTVEQCRLHGSGGGLLSLLC